MSRPQEYAVCVADCHDQASGRTVQAGTVGLVTGAGQRLCVDGRWWPRENWEAATRQDWEAARANPDPDVGPYRPPLVFVTADGEVEVAGHELVGGQVVAL